MALAPDGSTETLADGARGPTDEQRNAQVGSECNKTSNSHDRRDTVGSAGYTGCVPTHVATAVHRLEPMKGFPILTEDDVSVSDWESWFIKFERRIAKEVPKIPEERW